MTWSSSPSPSTSNLFLPSTQHPNSFILRLDIMKLSNPAAVSTLSAIVIIGTGVVGSIIPAVARSVTVSPSDPPPPSMLDLSKYNLSEATEGSIHLMAGIMTGLTPSNDDSRKYAKCVVTTAWTSFYDWKCLCKGGDGEGSAIMSTELLSAQVLDACGLDFTLCTSFLSFLCQSKELTRLVDVVFPEIQNFCRRVLSGETYYYPPPPPAPTRPTPPPPAPTRPTPPSQRRRSLLQPIRQPNCQRRTARIMAKQ